MDSLEALSVRLLGGVVQIERMCFSLATPIVIGALFGASIGSNFGAKNAVDRARRDELERLGITEEMLESARDVGAALDRSVEGLAATRESLESQQRLARRLDSNAEELYGKAKAALESSDEEAARKYLLERTSIQDKLKQVLLRCGEEKRRVETMESNVALLKEKAMEVNTLLKRAVGAKATQDTSDLGLSLTKEDPLLQKFRDLGID